MLQYASWAGIEPPADHWDENVMDGRGKAYGIEADIHYHTTRLDLAAAYTLSWNKRHYDEWYDGWFADKFDKQENRQGNDNKVERRLQEISIVQRHSIQNHAVDHLRRFQLKLKVCEIHSSDKQPERRHNHVGDNR